MSTNAPRILALLKTIRLFQGMDERQLARLTQAAELIELQEGQSPELDETRDYPFFVIAAGKISLIPDTDDNDVEYVLKKGDFFGADVLFTGKREEYQITAVVPSQLIAINSERLRALIQAIPRLQTNLREQLRIYRLMRLRQFDWVDEDETILLIQRKHPAYLLITLLAPLGLAWVAFLAYLFSTRIGTTSNHPVVEWLAIIGMVIAALWAMWRAIDYANGLSR